MAMAQAQPMMAVAQPAPVMAVAGAVVAQPQVVVQPVVMAPMPIVMFGRLPVLNTCQFCHQSGPTNVRYEPGMGTHAAAVCCCVPWIGIPLCCIPYSTAASVKRRLASVTTATISASTRSSSAAQGAPPRAGAQPSSPSWRRAVQPASRRPQDDDPFITQFKTNSGRRHEGRQAHVRLLRPTGRREEAHRMRSREAPQGSTRVVREARSFALVPPRISCRVSSCARLLGARLRGWATPVAILPTL